MIFINLSNHKLVNWDQNQTNEALKHGSILDMDFPVIDPLADEQVIRELVDKYYNLILSKAEKPNEITVHLMGEMTFTYQLVKRLQESGVNCLASTSVRTVIDLGKGMKNVFFKFERFRRYE